MTLLGCTMICEQTGPKQLTQQVATIQLLSDGRFTHGLGVLRRLRAPRSGDVRARPGAGCPGAARRSPTRLHAVGAGEQRLVTEHGVEDEPLTSLEAVGRAELVLLAEYHLRGAAAHLGRWLPGQEVGCDGNCGARLRLAWAACQDHR